jgi:chaperonin GroES
MKFRPLHDRVVIERIDAEAKTAGGIIIPDTAQEKPQQGKVIAVGPGGRDESGKLIPIDIKVGDRILFGKWSGTGSNRARGSSAICTPTRADGR